jgi:hypothetical protein
VHHPQQVLRDRPVDVDLPHLPLHVQHLCARDDRHQRLDGRPLALPEQDLHLVRERRIPQRYPHHEPIELRFGERVGAVELDRVLGGDHEERLGQVAASALHRHLVLAHHLQQRGLRPR